MVERRPNDDLDRQPEGEQPAALTADELRIAAALEKAREQCGPLVDVELEYEEKEPFVSMLDQLALTEPLNTVIWDEEHLIPDKVSFAYKLSKTGHFLDIRVWTPVFDDDGPLHHWRVFDLKENS